MKKSFIIVSILLAGCFTPATKVDAPVVTVVEPTNILMECRHKYDPGLNFNYIGPVQFYEQTLFGEEIFVFEYTTPSGDKVHISNYDAVNFSCKKAN